MTGCMNVGLILLFEIVFLGVVKEGGMLVFEGEMVVFTGG